LDAFDTIKHEDSSIFITNESDDSDKSDKASVRLYVINPNQQESVIADYGPGKVLWKFIGHKLGPGNSI